MILGEFHRSGKPGNRKSRRRQNMMSHRNVKVVNAIFLGSSGGIAYLSVIFTFALLLFATSCSDSEKTMDKKVQDVPAAQPMIFNPEEGILTALMDNSVTSYFILQGQPLGFEYEMLKLFADENNLELRIKVINQVDKILDSLAAGSGHLVAANLSISQDRMKKVSFSNPLFRTRQVLVQRLPANTRGLTSDQIKSMLVQDRLDLDARQVVVRKNSSYELMLKNLMAETGIEVDLQYSSGDLATEQLIELVANEKIEFTICDENKAIIFQTYYDNIDICTPMSLSQPIAWAVNKESDQLLVMLNDWIKKRKGSLEFNMIRKRYFERNRSLERRINEGYEFVKEGNISEYDSIIKRYASRINWDWRLLTAQIYRESRFDTRARSWKGATGLMQVMPATGRSYGLTAAELYNAQKNLRAGTAHLIMLQDLWQNRLTDSTEIVRFTLGSYNVGHGHVEDAIRLAEKYNLKKDVWDGNVAEMLLKKSIPKYYQDPVVRYGYCRGREPVRYVENILKDYELYKQFTE
jgi:membrane-bound lytic murein transglycosylase F